MGALTPLYSIGILSLLISTPDPVPQSPAATTSASRLLLRLDPGRGPFVLYEPVIVSYSVTNPTEEAVESGVDMDSGLQRLRLFIQEDAAPAVRFRSGAIRETLGQPRTAHGPHQVMTSEVWMFFNDSKADVAFPRTGQYTIVGEMLVGNTPDPVWIRAEPVQIEVVEPRAGDQRLIDALGSKERLVALFRKGPSEYCEGQPQGPCFEELRRLPRTFPDSVYAPHIMLSLARAISSGGLHVEPRRQVELELLTELLQKWPTHPIVAQAMESLALALNATGRKREAVEWVDRFERTYPGRQERVRFLRYEIQRLGGDEDHGGGQNP